MVRTQVQFTEAQARQLKSAAQREGTSVAEFVRQCVERRLAEEPEDRGALYSAAAELVGRFDDPAGASDLSLSHDRHLEGRAGAGEASVSRCSAYRKTSPRNRPKSAQDFRSASSR